MHTVGTSPIHPIPLMEVEVKIHNEANNAHNASNSEEEEGWRVCCVKIWLLGWVIYLSHTYIPLQHYQIIFVNPFFSMSGIRKCYVALSPDTVHIIAHNSVFFFALKNPYFIVVKQMIGAVHVLYFLGRVWIRKYPAALSP